MRRAGTAAVALAVVVAAVFLVDRYCVQPWKCALAATRVQRRIDRLAGASDLVVRAAVRDDLDMLRPCTTCCPDSLDYLMAKAGNQLAVDDYRGALATYEHALTVDRRPEIYVNIGLTQLNLFRTAEATESIMTAARFNYGMTEPVPDPVKTTVYLRIVEERKKIISRREQEKAARGRGR